MTPIPSHLEKLARNSPVLALPRARYPREMQIRTLSEHTGAEVTGIDLSSPVDAATRAALNRAFVEHRVLAIRDQHLAPRQVVAAVELFGEIFHQHNTRFALPECPEIPTTPEALPRHLP